MKSFYVLLCDFNTKQPEKYDIMLYLLNTYKKCLERNHWWPMDNPNIKPESTEDFKHFVDRACRYQYWARCEYEWLMLAWPYGATDTIENCKKVINSSVKLDAYEQIKMNLDIITSVFMDNLTEA